MDELNSMTDWKEVLATQGHRTSTVHNPQSPEKALGSVFNEHSY
jgi:hypothetical protein